MVQVVLPPEIVGLDELATNLRWSWHRPTRDVFASIDPKAWEAVGHQPHRLLGAVPPSRLAQLAGDEGFRARLAAALADLHGYLDLPRWYQGPHEGHPEGPVGVAYFSPEYGITEALPQYSGGLGILAGDHLKAASDLGVPVIGIGLLYRSGYFRQSMDSAGWQQETYPVLDPHELPVTLLRGADGQPLTVWLTLPQGRSLGAQVWRAQVGRVPLLLLDSDIEQNAPRERGVTDRLYGGGGEHRLLQELLLGVGGVRALRAFCAATGTVLPEVFHSNEGHAGFLGVERIRALMAEGADFGTALETVRAGTVFTTHTPVPAGIDRFPREQVAQYLDALAGEADGGGLDTASVLALGAEPDGGDPGLFNMALMGLRLAQHANGVARLHGKVSRAMFHGLWSAFDEDEVPITSVTNGVHVPTWVSPLMSTLAAERGAPELGSAESWSALASAGDSVLWQARHAMRSHLVAHARDSLRAAWLERGASPAELGWVDDALSPDVLTIGFARRVPSYKRLTLMLADPRRLRALLLDPRRPVQILVAGKAHPADDGGKRLIQQLIAFADGEDVRHRIAFLPDYDMAMAAWLYPGCDVWLNNPLRPLEACGTSGMKAALNGSLNLSVRDGWWDEMYDGSNGWAIPTADGVADPERRDALEANALYDLVEHVVAPLYYERDEEDVPTRWMAMVRHTLATLGPQLTADRMVKQYVAELYTPAAAAGRRLAQDGVAAELACWKARVVDGWGGVSVEHVETAGAADGPRVGEQLTLRALVKRGTLEATDVRVQAVVGRVDTLDRFVDATTTVDLVWAGQDGPGLDLYLGELTLDRAGSLGYTVRVVPQHPLLARAVEMNLLAEPSGPAAITEGILR